MKNSISLFVSCLLVTFLCFVAGCRPLQINTLTDRFAPSNVRQWSPELAAAPSAVITNDTVQIKNIRNLNYVTKDDFVVNYFDRTIRLNDIQSVDFIVTPFPIAPALAHTMLSFGLADGSYLGVSVEVRSEIGEKYSPLLGVGNQFELTYVVADERDLIRLRTRHRDDDVYVYPTIASAEQSRELFVSVMERANKLYDDPEFYHSIVNNCTSNLVDHINDLKPNRVGFSWRALLPGFSAEYAYDLGLLDKRVPFEDLHTIAYINDLAETYHDSADFSQRIRSRRSSIDRLAQGQLERNAGLNAAGQQFLDERIATDPFRYR